VSNTKYQNTLGVAIDLFIPVTYNPTSGAAATCAADLGPQSSFDQSAIATDTYPANGPAGITNTFFLRVPSGWYYRFTVTNATIGSGYAIPEQ
jgi:hypothetical protein